MSTSDIVVYAVAAVVVVVAVVVLVVCAAAQRQQQAHEVREVPAAAGPQRTPVAPTTAPFNTPDARAVALVYAPWCKHCKELLPVFAKLKSAGFRVEVVDGTVRGSNWLAANSVTRYPTICVVEGDTVLQQFPFSGPRTEDAILDFYNSLHLA